MSVVLVLLFLTVTLGVVVLGLWDHPQRRGVDRVSFVLGAGHVIVALSAVIAWAVYVMVGSSVIGGVATAVLLVTVALGVSTLLSTRRGNRSSRYADAPHPVPIVVLALHGAAATAAVVLAVVVASR